MSQPFGEHGEVAVVGDVEFDGVCRGIKAEFFQEGVDVLLWRI